jgi:hypothetical protein
MKNTVNVKTNYYNFPMTYKISETPPMVHFHVGDKMKPCLEFSVMLQDAPEYLQKNIDTVYLGKVDSLIECVTNDINSDYMEKYSLGKELINVVIKTMKTHFPYVKKIELIDPSYIPCNRAHNESLDLLTYSIALYGETWYEKTFGAQPVYGYEDYRKKVEKYKSSEFKKQIKFETILSIIAKTNNMYALNLIYSNLEYYQTLYNNYETLPQFFKKLSKIVDKKDKCKLFKSWLEYFMNDILFHGRIVDQKWIIYISQNGGKKRNKTQRRKYFKK